MSASPTDRQAIRSAVRRNWIWAAGAAAIMLWFGIGAAIPPDAVAPQKQGWLIFLYTLQVGGGAMALSAVLSLLGVPLALCYDAIVSVAVGAAFILSGVLIYGDNGQQAVFNVLFGVVFGHSGYRNWREFNSVVALEERDGAEDAADGSTGLTTEASGAPGAVEEEPVSEGRA